MDRGFAVYSINPKQLDRFRDRFSPAGAKDDSRDARVLADAAVWDALSNGVPAGEPRTWVCESSYRAGSWSRSRRVVQVRRRPGELIPRCFR